MLSARQSYCSICSVQYGIVERLRETGDMKRKQGSGRKKMLMAREESLTHRGPQEPTVKFDGTCTRDYISERQAPRSSSSSPYLTTLRFVCSSCQKEATVKC